MEAQHEVVSPNMLPFWLKCNPSYFDTFLRYHLQRFREMAPMKAKAAVRAMSKGGIAEALASGCEVKKSVASKLLDTLASVATAEVKKTGVFTVPDWVRLKIHTKPATKARKREVFGKKSL